MKSTSVFVVALAVLTSGSTFAAPGLSPSSLRPLNARFDKGSSVAVDFPVNEYEALRRRIESSTGLRLKSRGEAHLTVVTPIEYKTVSPQDRERLMQGLKAMDWSKDPLRALCVGKGSVELNNTPEQTFFVVVEASALRKLRELAGLRTPFYPHITLGFTRRDLHLEDGVIKDCKHSARGEDMDSPERAPAETRPPKK